MKKRIIALILSTCLIFSVLQPAMASYADVQNIPFEDYEKVWASGDRIAIVPSKYTEDYYEYLYYKNGVYIAKYNISYDDLSIFRIDATTGKRTMVETGAAVKNEILKDIPYVTGNDIPTYAGRIIFNYSAELRDAPVGYVKCESRSGTSEKQVVAEKGKEVADTIMLLTGILLAVGFYYVPAASLAEQIIQAAFAADVGLIENGIFTSARTETWTYHYIFYTVYVEISGQSSATHTGVYSGAERWVSCRSFFTSTDEYDVQGVTRRNWMSSSNVRMFWGNAYGDIPYPGHKILY